MQSMQFVAPHTSADYWDSHFDLRYGAFVFWSMWLGKLISENGDDYSEHMDILLAAIKEIELKRGVGGQSQTDDMDDGEDILRDPNSYRNKGRVGASSSSTRKNPRWVNHCSTCGEPRHNKKTCGAHSQHPDTAE